MAFTLANTLTPLTYHPYPLIPVTPIASTNNNNNNHNNPHLTSSHTQTQLQTNPPPSSPPPSTAAQTPNMNAAQYLPLSQIAPPRHVAASPSPILTTISPAAMTLQAPSSRAQSSMALDDDDSDDSDAEVSEMDEDDDDVDASYKERSRSNKRAGQKRGSAASTTLRKSSSDASVSAPQAKRQKTGDATESSSSTAPPKRRGNGRITVAEFVPPDVTGLSKREARLVKNRAAAFLSRQRKREEFESMEQRLTQALEENARLRASNGQSPAPANEGEVDRLRALLQEAEQREKQLREELESAQQHQSRIPTPTPALLLSPQPMVKAEEPELFLPMPGGLDMSPASSHSEALSKRFPSVKEKESKSGPGLSLMMLVFSLSLLSLPHQAQLHSHMRNSQASQPTPFSFTPSGSASAPTLPMLSNILEKWDGVEHVHDDDDEMEVELEPVDDDEKVTEESGKKGSYIVDFEMPVLADEVQSAEDGKIRVRIQPCGVPRPRGTSPMPSVPSDATPCLPYITDAPAFDALQQEGDWAGWREFLNEEVFGGDAANAHLLPASSFNVPPLEASEYLNLSYPAAHSDTASDAGSRYITPPPSFPEGAASPGSTFASEIDEDNTVLSSASLAAADKAPVDIDVALSSLPSWSRALVKAAQGEKLRAKIRLARGNKYAKRSSGKSRSSKVGFTLRV